MTAFCYQFILGCGVQKFIEIGYDLPKLTEAYWHVFYGPQCTGNT